MSTRILIVDRNPQLVRILGISLRQQGYQTDAAADGRCALAAAARQPPALVVLDLYPPDLTGVEVIRRLRRWSRAPILVRSGRARTGDMVAALDVGADDYVTNRSTWDELLAGVRAWSRWAGDTPGISRVRIGGHAVDLARHRITGP